MKKTILDGDDLAEISPFFRGKMGSFFANVFLTIFGVSRINKVYSKLYDLEGVKFTEGWLKSLNVRYVVENEHVLEHLPDGAFITVSNHPFGGLDGVILVDLIAKRRSDYKFMVNSLLMHVQTLSNQFVGVKPSTPKSGSSIENTGGLKQTLFHLKNGGSMGFFPAGAVAGYYHSVFKITEKDWQPTVIRLIQTAKVPVIPIYIHGRNSRYFTFLGLIHWQLRTIRMAHEVLNKGGQVIKVSVGEIISWEEQAKYKSVDELAAFLKTKTIELSK